MNHVSALCNGVCILYVLIVYINSSVLGIVRRENGIDTCARGADGD